MCWSTKISTSTRKIWTNLNKYSIVVLLQMASRKCLSTNPALISNGFKRTGIYLWNPSEPDVNKLLPSSIFTPDRGLPSTPPSSFTSSVPQDAPIAVLQCRIRTPTDKIVEMRAKSVWQVNFTVYVHVFTPLIF
jgi:hypothetical protein